MDTSREEELHELLDALGKGDETRIQRVLASLGVNDQSETYARIDEMARNLHKSLLDFNQSMSTENVTMHSTTLPDAVAKLEHVMEITFHAADKTLDSIEKQNDILSESYAALEKTLDEMTAERIPDQNVRHDLKKLLEAERARIERSLAINNEIILTQEFQDLTGQSIQKVIKLVHSIKDNVSSLMDIFGADDLPQASQVTSDEQALDENKLEQDDIDSVLKDCGF